MRRYIPALEQALSTNPMVDESTLEPIADVVSLEEEQLISEEIAQMGGDIADAFVDAQRTIEVSDSLENAADIAEAIEVATPAETQLLEVIGEAAGAGSNLDPSDIVPSMESFKGKKIAVEGLRDTAARIWENIKRFVKQIWEKIQKMFYNLFGMVPALRRRVLAMQEKVDGLPTGQQPEKTFKIKIGLQRLLVNGKPISNGAALKKGLDEMRKVSSSVYGPLADNVASVGTKMAAVIARFDVNKAKEGLKDVIDVVIDSGAKGKAAVHTAKATNRFKGYTAFESEQLMGDVVVVSKLFNDSKGDTALLHAADAVSKSGVSVEASGNDVKAPTEVVFSTLTQEDMHAVLSEALSILDVLENFRRGSKQAALTKAESAMDSASGRASQALVVAKGTTAVGTLLEKETPYRDSIPYYRAMINMNLAYARWAQNPFGPFFQVALNSVKTALGLVEKSVSQYK